VFLTGRLLARADSVVVFNEIHYHPLTNEAQLEWVELQNQLSVDVDISGWRIDGGIHFTFAEGTVIPAAGFLVVALSPASLLAVGVSNVVGPFDGRLSNNGDRLQLKNNNHRLLDEVSYGVEQDWPVAPDGAGPSLARRARNLAGSDPANWSASAQIGGTPGADNFPARPPPLLTNSALSLVASWKFQDAGLDLGAAWHNPDYDDSTWAAGAAPFYLNGGPLPGTGNTPVAPGRITYYFRARFTVTNDLSRTELRLRPLLDDGAVVYLNGLELARVNMPAGPIAYSTPALSAVGQAVLGDTLIFPGARMVPGTNLLAVEVHQGPAIAAYPQAVLDSGPVAYWRLGETTGPALDAASGPGAPQSGAQNGIYAGFAPSSLGQAGPRATDQVNGQPLAGFDADNLATAFAGNSDRGNDVITIADPGVLNFSTTGRFTLEAWVSGSPAQEEGAAIIAKGTGGGEQYAMDVVGGLYRFFAWDGGTPNTLFSASAAVGPDGTWQHVVAVLDQPAARMKIYVNGLERGSAVPRSTLIDSTHEVSIGARQNTGSVNYDLNFNGRIDEVAIYNRALSAAEILAHFNAALSNHTAAGVDTNDLAFGLEVATAELAPEPPSLAIAFNELASSTNGDFWLELINFGPLAAELGGCVVARFGGTNRQYALPPQTLAPGQLRVVTKAELGFGVDSGDRLALFPPDRQRVLDAVVAKKDPRGRSPDGTGRWRFPVAPTPGASNAFIVHDELVINELMFHHRELPPLPATFSPTNQWVTISNVWKYHAEGLALGTAWRDPAYDDSAWPASAAVFYAPTNFFVLPAPKNTFLPLTNSAGARILTFYFRTQFFFDGETNGLLLGLRFIVDDGAAFYLNGTEVLRVNLPATNITYNTLATVNVGTPGFTGPILIPAGGLRPGLNTLAVEVHQAIPSSSDFDFGSEVLTWTQLTPALPFRPSPESWVEILNRSSNTVNLAGWRLDEGIDYRFPSNHTLAPGGFLVVAKDVDAMRSVYPEVDVLGPFTNKLSTHSDQVVLKDPNNNPAYEVRYFAGRPWPEEADGGGSSLELRDPRSDPAQPGSWAASDESVRSSWQTYTWRGVAAPGQVNEPTLWHELALCLVDGAGEVLLDDFSLIETPATTPRQLLANGGFDDGSAAHWRFLGNHRHSRVEPEPGHPANYVLHLVASGPGEYQGNQIETTLTNNVSVVDGREYEISFRARWLAGKNKLNARLYFNRLARTFDLAAPARNGTPGAPNSRRISNLGPSVGNLTHAPVVPQAGWPVAVTVTVSDPDGVSGVSLHYSVNGRSWQQRPMTRHPTPGSPSEFAATIPGQDVASIVQFYVEAVDQLGTVTLFPAGGTNSRALFMVQDGQAIAGPTLHNFRLIMTPADAMFLHTGTNTLSNELLGCTVIEDEREVYYDCGVRLKGSFVGRNSARAGLHVQFNDDHPFRGVHRIVSVDRSTHAGIGGTGEILVKHIAAHAGGIPDMNDDLAYYIAPLPGYTTMAELRLTGFDNDYLDAQFQNGSDGSQYEIEVLRWETATLDGNPEGTKQVGNDTGGTGYANLEVQDYGDVPESYRWFWLHVNNREADDYTQAIALCETFSLNGASFDAQASRILDLDEWLRTMAYQELVGIADAYFTGISIHNFRVYIRPADQRALYLPWDWDSAFLASASAPIIGTGNIAKLLTNPNNRRVYLNHLYDLINTTFNTSYLSRWTTHYAEVGRQNFASVLSYVGARATFVLGQLPTATAFAITNNAGNNFETNTPTATLSGTAPIGVKTIEVNGIPYAVTWSGNSSWSLRVPLFSGSNPLLVQGVDNHGFRLPDAIDAIIVTNTGPLALRPVVINEWMADNRGPGGLPDPGDGLFQDWFELFNPNASPVSLGGFYLTDDLSRPTKWRIPTNTVISAGGFLLVWADGDTTQNAVAGGTDVDLHASFQLSSGGEAIGLYTGDGVTPLSTVTFGPQLQNVSQGRFPDGDTNAVFFMTNYTPRAANTLGGLGDLRILSAVREDGALTLTWNTIPGRAYQVEYKTALDDPVWSPLAPPLYAVSTSAHVLDDSLPRTQRFYRVLLLR